LYKQPRTLTAFHTFPQDKCPNVAVVNSLADFTVGNKASKSTIDFIDGIDEKAT
jgi:hypothetical protein